MSTPAAPSESPDHAAWAQAARRRQVEALEDLAQSGLRLAQAIEGGAIARQAAEAGAPGEAAMGFARVARAVRMTCLLQSRLLDDMDKALIRQACEDRSQARRAQDEADEARDNVKDRAHAIVARVAWAQDGADADSVERVTDETSERLETDDIYGDVLARPMADLVADICRDLGLEPDWERLGREAWMDASTPSRPLPFSAENGRGGPLADPGAEPGVEPMVEREGHIHALEQAPPQSGGMRNALSTASRSPSESIVYDRSDPASGRGRAH